ncbi:MAG TPA: hypothetical protein VGF18_01975 [Candidatus Tumulicola sp.]
MNIITGPRTGLNHPQAVAIAKSHEIVVSNYAAHPSVYASITVFAAGSADNASPVRTITGPSTQLSRNFGIAIDAKGNIYVSETDAKLNTQVAIFGAGANGDAKPKRVIKLRHAGHEVFWGLAVDGSDRTVVTAPFCDCGNGGKNEVVAYPRDSKGFASPSQRIVGNHTHLQYPNGVALDAEGKMYVSNLGSDGGSITVFESQASGDPSPIQSISGADTGLLGPVAIAVDSTDQIYEVDAPGPSIDVFAAQSNGDVAPIRLIAGSNTGLSGALGIAVR